MNNFTDLSLAQMKIKDLETSLRISIQKESSLEQRLFDTVFKAVSSKETSLVTEYTKIRSLQDLAILKTLFFQAKGL